MRIGQLKMSPVSNESVENREATVSERWWNRKAFFYTLTICAIVGLSQYLWLQRVLLPENYVFERLPIITGEWWSGGCGNGYTCARVGNTPVYCSTSGYFVFVAASRGVCGHLRIPNGEMITAERIKIPTSDGDNYIYLISAKSPNQQYFLESDREVRDRWVRNSKLQIGDTIARVALFSYLILLGISTYRK